MGLLALLGACDRPLAVAPTKAVTQGLSVCWRSVDSGDEGTDRSLRVAMAHRLEGAGYVLVKDQCDLSISWGYTTKGRDYDMAFRTARLSVRAHGDKLIEHREFEFGPSDLPMSEPDRLAIVLVNALNASASIAALNPAGPSPSARRTPPPPATLNGRLPPATIQRVVRARFPSFKQCYDDALRSDPAVHGRTATKFVIDRSGHVSSSVDTQTDSTLPKDVRDCVAERFRPLEFPPPGDGAVTVIYPLVFSPSTPDAATAGADAGTETHTSIGDAGVPFDRSAAARALDEAARSISSCSVSAGPRGAGHVTLRFAPSGQVEFVSVDGGSFANTPAGACVAARFGQARIPPFTGNPVTVGKSFRLK